MSWYRFYLCNAAGKARHATEMEAIDDSAALRQAAELRHPHLVEVWRKTQRVGRVPGTAGPVGADLSAA